MPAFEPALKSLTIRSGGLSFRVQAAQKLAIRRPAFDGPAHELAVVVEHFLDQQRRQQRDRVADGGSARRPERRQ